MLTLIASIIYNCWEHLAWSDRQLLVFIQAEVYKVICTVLIACGAHSTDLINGNELRLSSSPWRCCVHTRGTPFCFPSSCGDCGLGWNQRATVLSGSTNNRAPRWICGWGVVPTIDEFIGVLENCFKETTKSSIIIPLKQKGQLVTLSFVTVICNVCRPAEAWWKHKSFESELYYSHIFLKKII